MLISIAILAEPVKPLMIPTNVMPTTLPVPNVDGASNVTPVGHEAA